MHCIIRRLGAAAFLVALAALSHAQTGFVTFDSGHVRPLLLSDDGTELYALNTPDGQLEIFNVGAGGISHAASVPVGMEPVALAARNANELWVVNHLSDSVSIVDLATRRVTRTLLVGDEPRDIVFAGTESQRAFITTAHRGQRRTHADLAAVPGAGDPQLATPSVPRADVWVFKADAPGSAAGGVPVAIVELFGDTPRALAASADGSTVYAAIFHSGNRTTAIPEAAVCDGFDPVNPCPGDPNAVDGAPGGNPGPSANLDGDPAPEVGLILRYNETSGHWEDELARDWDAAVRFDLPDKDVFAIDADTLAETAVFTGVGTVLFNMTVNPANGNVYVTNTDALNDVRFEGPGGGGSTVVGNLHQARITVLDGAQVTTRHLNKHIDYATSPAAAGTSDHSLATPLQSVISSTGKLYVAAFGSARIGVIETAALDSNAAWDDFDPETASADYLNLTGGGPSGLALDEARNRLYVLTRFDNSVAALDLASGTEVRRVALHNPEPAHVVAGRPFLFDANLTSSNGEASCSSCHVFGDLDSLAWDLGNPDDEVTANPMDINLEITAFTAPSPINGSGDPRDFHPMKGPMTTQTLRGLVTGGAMHWRGDRATGEFGTDPTDTTLSFNNFIVAFEGLVGRDGPVTDEEMEAFTAYALELALPPNPVRALDNSLTASQQAGRDFYFGPRKSDGLNIEGFGFTCNGCHVLDPSIGAFGNGGKASFEQETQIVKIPHLRNLYQKIGMFGLPDIRFIVPGDNEHMGDQIRGYGVLHDGSIDTLFRFFSAAVFQDNGQTGFQNDDQRRDMEQFMLAFDSDLAPITGQQATLSATATLDANARVDLLIARADAPFVSAMLGAGATECDLVVKGRIADQPRGWHYTGGGQFLADDGTTIADAALRDLAETPGQDLTYTCQPYGSGARAGVNRDGDAVHDALDNCPAAANDAQADTDGDGVGDVCDNCTLLANAAQRDTDGDGYGNFCDADLNNDGDINFLDLGAMKAVFFGTDPVADLTGDGVVNFVDLGLMKASFFGKPGPSGVAD